MGFRNGLCFMALICVVTVQVGLAQEGQLAQYPRSADPFSLSPGSSFSASGGQSPSAVPRTSRSGISADVAEALDIIGANHVLGSRINTESVTESAIAGMLRTLDPHSKYYDPTEFQDLIGEHHSEYSGTGCSIAGFERSGTVDTFVISTFPGSPAARAGLRFGDRIISVNGRKVGGESPDTVRDLMRGPRGTSISVTVERAGSSAIETVDLKRERVHDPAVPKGFMLQGTTGYVDLTGGFSNTTFAEFESVINELKRSGMQSLVLDLRGNGGGILEQAVRVAEKFLAPGTTIVSQRGRSAGDDKVWKASKARYESGPLVLLVNEQTASASEVLAGALQDNDRALILGRRTFGKGLVQSVLNLPRGAGLTLTAARYYTPTGRSIQRDYSSTGVYDYFNHRSAEIDKPAYAAKTPTKRVVYGGDGIAPDEVGIDGSFSRERIRLLDPIFFFARERTASLTGDAVFGALGSRRGSKPAAVFGRSAVDESALADFLMYVAQSPDWRGLQPDIEKDHTFVRQMLGYYLSMGVRGADAADRARIKADPQVKQAVDSLPRAAQLYTAAQKAASHPKKEKSSLSLVLSEPR